MNFIVEYTWTTH